MPQCVICLDDDNNDSFYNLPDCNHTFHTNCIISWFRSGKSTCPCCKSEEPRIEEPLYYKKRFSFLRKLAKLKIHNISKDIIHMIEECAGRVEIQKNMYRDLKKYIKNSKGDYTSIKRSIRRKTKNYEKYVLETDEYMKEISTCNFDQIIIPVRKVYYS